MKILHVLSQYPDSTGSGIYLQAILQQARQRQHTNSLIAGINAERRPDIESIGADRVALIEFNTPKLSFALPGMSDVMPYPSSRFYDLSIDQVQAYEAAFLQAMQKQIAACPPDIIHSHHLWLVSSLIKDTFPDIPLVTSCHGSDLRQYQLCPHLRERIHRGCTRIDKVFALTGAQQEEIRKIYGFTEEAIAIVGAGYNDAIFSWSAKAPTPPIHICYCGKLSRAKGVPWLIQAIEELNLKSIHLHLLGSGSGPEKEECLKLAQGLEDRVTVHGPMSQEQLAWQLRNSHVFILPSLYEGLPLAILEALACGCRIIATDIPGCRAIAEKLDDGLLSLVQAPRLQNVDSPLPAQRQPSLPQRTIEKNTRNFRWQAIFEKIENIYYDLLDNR